MLRAADGPGQTVAGPRAQEIMISRTAQAPSLRRTLSGLRRYRHLLRNLVLKDLKLKYRGSVVGFLWSLANPILMGVVYTVAFTSILKIHNQGFVFYLMLGLLAWTFFASSVGMATGAIADNGGLVKSVWFPRAILPTATVLFNLTQYLLSVVGHPAADARLLPHRAGSADAALPGLCVPPAALHRSASPSSWRRARPSCATSATSSRSPSPSSSG